ncbi:MAG: transcriptional repressor LexA [Syntrophomonas sp.]|nr:transcriptional repressor LexA [Syntrophomonas sp.]
MNSSTDLNQRQQDIMNFIRERINTKGYPPSVREIGEAVGLKSSSTVHAHLVKLEEKGLLKKDPTKPRTLMPVNMGNSPNPDFSTISLPVVGNVAAGTPILATENIESYFPVPIDFAGSGNHFILHVKGDSMIEAGILNGDYLIVREQKNASNGEIIVALLEDEATVKRYYKRDHYIELRPENSSMQPIISSEVTVIGKVTGLLRHM